MDGFDPDAYLGSSPPSGGASFDPDAYLTAAPSAPAAPSSPSVAGDVAKSGGIGLVKGAIGLAGLPGDINSLVGKGFDWAAGKAEQAMGYTPEQSAAKAAARQNLRSQMPLGLPTSSGIQDAIEGQTGKFYEPQTTAGQYAQTVGEFAPAALAGPGSVARKLTTQAVVPALASETAGQLTKGTEAEPYARVAAGVLGGVGAGAAANSLASKAAKVTTPSIDEIKDAARAQYNHPEVAAVKIKPQAVSDLSDSIRADLEGQGFRDWAHPKPFKALDELTAPRTASATAANAPVTVKDIDAVQKLLRQQAMERNAIGQLTPDAIAAARANEKVSDFLSGLKQPDLIAGNAKKAASILGDARANWGAASRAQEIQTLQDNARIQAGSTYSGGNQNNATRQALRPLLKNDAARAYGYNQDELDQLNRAVTGTVPGNTARWVGKRLGNLASTAGVVGGVATGNLPLAVGVPAVGMAARAIGNASAARQGRLLDEMLRNRSPLAQAAAAASPAVQTQPVWNRAMLNALSASSAAREQPEMNGSRPRIWITPKNESSRVQ